MKEDDFLNFGDLRLDYLKYLWMKLHGDALDDTKATFFVEKLEDELTDRSDLAIRVLERVLQHLLNFIERILRPNCILKSFITN